jgi:plastocyanin
MAAKFALCLLPLAFAAQQTVQVGAQGLQFLPNTVYAGVGDTIQFEFVTPGHSVVQGTYSKPCIPASDSSFFSGVLDAVSHSHLQAHRQEK